MKEGTIPWAISEVLKRAGNPLTVREIYQAIVEQNLYIFKADDPIHVVYTQARRHCVDFDIPSAINRKKYFSITSNGKYFLISQLENISKGAKETETSKSDIETSQNLLKLYKDYVFKFRERVLNQLKELDPSTFEIFSKNLLEAYGFKEVNVTNTGPDGGIDGFGNLKVGLATIQVAFQCKRWKKKVGRPDIDRFRGAIQGKCEQGMFFTTSAFTGLAEKASIQKGAVPIILIDGELILDLMIDKKFGIEVENLPIYKNALDLVVSDEN